MQSKCILIHKFTFYILVSDNFFFVSDSIDNDSIIFYNLSDLYFSINKFLNKIGVEMGYLMYVIYIINCL